MPIIKSSQGGEHITTVIFNTEEIEALAHLLKSASFPTDSQTIRAKSSLEDLAFALGIDLKSKL